MARLKQKHLEHILQDVEVFEKPKIHLEQYATSPHLAACFLHSIFEDIEDKMVVDLGCGCGTLSFGAEVLGASYVLGLDVDPEALDLFVANKTSMELEVCEAVACDVLASLPPSLNDKFDTAIMNPPFGTRTKGVDLEFVRAGLCLAPVVYSLHKSSTRSHILKKAPDLGASECKVLAQMRFDLPQSYKFHTKKSVDIDVDLIKFHR